MKIATLCSGIGAPEVAAKHIRLTTVPAYDRMYVQEGIMPAHRKEYPQAVQMYNKGMSIEVVAGFYGVTRQSMWMYLKRRGVIFRDHLKYQSDNHFYRGNHRSKDDERARKICEYAVKKGIIERKTTCEQCGDGTPCKDGRSKVHAHHVDYNKPLNIMWLCQGCHHEWHKHNKATPANI